jgi:hypothetical protein
MSKELAACGVEVRQLFSSVLNQIKSAVAFLDISPRVGSP